MLPPTTEKAESLKRRIVDFMNEHVYPAEKIYSRQLDEAPTRWSVPPVIEELKAKAKARRPVEHVPAQARIPGRSDQCRICDALRGDGPLADRFGGLQLLRARHRQYGDHRPLRHRRAQGAVAEAAAWKARSAPASA